MDAQTAQLRHHIAHTRAALDVTLAQLEPHVLGPVCGVQETAARATALLSRYRWLIIAAGAFAGYQLRRAQTRPGGCRILPRGPPCRLPASPRRRAPGRPSTSPRGHRPHQRWPRRRWEYPVTRVTSGAAAVDAARTRRPSLVFMDMHLPGAMDGWQAAAHIWAQWRMPIISLTGHAAPHLLSAVQTAPPVFAWSKPFTKTPSGRPAAARRPRGPMHQARECPLLSHNDPCLSPASEGLMTPFLWIGLQIVEGIRRRPLQV
jgi:CheY-like chemotaxis protein